MSDQKETWQSRVDRLVALQSPPTHYARFTTDGGVSEWLMGQWHGLLTIHYNLEYFSQNDMDFSPVARVQQMQDIENHMRFAHEVIAPRVAYVSTWLYEDLDDFIRAADHTRSQHMQDALQLCKQRVVSMNYHVSATMLESKTDLGTQFVGLGFESATDALMFKQAFL